MLSTAATRLLGIDHPVVQAGMARGYTSADLVAAVSEAGGLGVLGCLNRRVADVVSELERIRSLTDRPFGVNFVVEHIDWSGFEACLGARVPVFTFFRGEPHRVVPQAKLIGATVIYQVTTVGEAEDALRAGADALVAQGTEAGGHAGPIPLAALLPAVVELAGDRPVLAAGAIVDGRSLAAAMTRGAAGAWMGTRFLATVESPASPGHKQAIVDAPPGATVRTAIFDLIWGRPWPGVEVRAIRNRLTDRWVGREGEVAARRAAIWDALASAIDRDDAAEIDLLAGEGSGLIRDVRPAADVVRQISRDAERLLDEEAASQATEPPPTNMEPERRPRPP